MLRWARLAYLVLSWALVAGLVVQVFLIGAAIFDGGDQFRTMHRNVGYVVHFWPLLVLAAAWLSKAGKAHWQWAAALAVVGLIFPLMTLLADTSPLLAALHPVGAFIAFVLAVIVARNAWTAYRMPLEAAAGG